MHSKCHNATDPVTQNDYLVPLSNALYSIWLRRETALLFIRVSDSVRANKHRLDSGVRSLQQHVLLTAANPGD